MAKKTYEELVGAVVAAWSNGEKSAAAASIAVGLAAHRAIRFRLHSLTDRKSRRDSRAEVLATIAGRLQAAGHRTTPNHVGRYVQVAMVSLCYGAADARKQPVSLLRLFAGTLRRDTSTEEWSIRPKISEAARALWEKILDGQVKPGQVAAAVDQLLGRKPRKAPPKTSATQRVLQGLARLPEDQQRAIYAALGRKFSQAKAA